MAVLVSVGYADGASARPTDQPPVPYGDTLAQATLAAAVPLPCAMLLPVTVGRLLATGLGLLFLSLLLVLDLGSGGRDPSSQGVTVQAWFIEVFTLVGAGFVVSAAVFHAVQRAAPPAPKPPNVDHYS